MSRNRLVTFATFTVLLLAMAPSLFAQVSVTAANPSSAAPGTVNLNVTISGSGFKKGAKAQFFLTGTTNPGDVVVNSTAFSGANQVVANISVSSTATDASYDIQVVNTNGSSGKGTELFGVLQGGGSCNDIPVTITFAAGTTPYTYGSPGSAIFGDVANYVSTGPNDPFNGGSVFTDGVGGVYAKFQVCNGTNDLILNVNSGTKRFLNYDFTRQLASAASSATYQGGTVWNGGTGSGFINANEIYNSSLYDPVTGVLSTCLGTSLAFRPGTTSHTRYSAPSVGGVTLGCGTDSNTNSPYPTAVIQVTRPDHCTYILQSQPSSGSYHVNTVSEQINSNGMVAGGQYDMPLLVKVHVNNACTP